MAADHEPEASTSVFLPTSGRPRATRVLPATLLSATILLVSLAGCTVIPSSQTVQISYDDGDGTQTSPVDFSTLICGQLGDTYAIGSGVRLDDGPSTFVVSANNDLGSYGVLMRITDELWFVLVDEFTVDSESVTFDDLEGQVGPLKDGTTAIDPVDRHAHLTGELQCTN